MRPGQEHPEQLLWYVMGDLPADEMHLTREHLRFCSSCRDEAAGLVSTLKALQLERGAAGEVEDETPVVVAAPHKPAPPSLRLVPSPHETGPGVSRPGARFFRPALSVLVAIAVLSLPAAWALWRPEPVARVIEPVRRVTMLPIVRGETAVPVLEGSGPWLVRVVLPFDAPAGPYSLRLGTGKGTPGELGETVTENQDGALELILQPLESGRYQLTVDIDTRPPHDTFVYSFEVHAPPFWRSPQHPQAS